MGNKLSLNPENYPEVWIQGKSCWHLGWEEISTPKFPFDDKPSEIRDNHLWDRFGEAIDEHLPEINRHLKVLYALYFLPLMGFVVTIHILERKAMDYSKTFAKKNYAGLFIFSTLFVFMVGLNAISQKNKVVDKKIESICELFNVEFLKIGYSVEYRTKWTNLLCKPRNVAPQRLIVFKPYGTRTNGQIV